MAVDDDHPDLNGPRTDGQLESRERSVEDLVELCRNLNELGAEYIIIGGFAIRAAGFDRRTMDIDVLVASVYSSVSGSRSRGPAWYSRRSCSSTLTERPSEMRSASATSSSMG